MSDAFKLLSDLRGELATAKERIEKQDVFLEEYDKQFKELSETATTCRLAELEALQRVMELEAQLKAVDKLMAEARFFLNPGVTFAKVLPTIIAPGFSIDYDEE